MRQETAIRRPCQAGRVARFCNLTSWCVLPDYRSPSISLLTALLRQGGYHFTVLTPDVGPQEPDKRNPLAVAAAAAWLGVGFVMVVAGACWARGAPAWGGPSVGWAAVCSPAAVPGVCILQESLKTMSLADLYNMDDRYVF